MKLDYITSIQNPSDDPTWSINYRSGSFRNRLQECIIALLERFIDLLNGSYLRAKANTTDKDDHLTQFATTQYDRAEGLTFSSVSKVKCTVEHYFQEMKGRSGRPEEILKDEEIQSLSTPTQFVPGRLHISLRTIYSVKAT